MQPSLIFLFILLKYGTEDIVVQVIVLETFNDSFQVKRKFKLPFHDLHEISLANKSRFISSSSQSNEGVN